MRTNQKIALTLLACLSVSASFGAKSNPVPFPSDVGEFEFRLISSGLRKASEIPAGSYTDEEKRIIYTGHQKGMNFSILTGPIGVIAANQANKKGGKSQSRKMGSLANADVEEIFEQSILSEFETNAPGVLSQASAAHAVEFSPYIMLNVNDKDGSMKIYAMTTAQLREEGGEKPVWRTLFYSEVVGEYPSDGEAESEVAALEIVKAFERLAWSVRKVVTMEFDQYTPTKINARLAGFKNDKFPVQGVILAEDGEFALTRVIYSFVPNYTINHMDSLKLSAVKKMKDHHKEAFVDAINN